MIHIFSSSELCQHCMFISQNVAEGDYSTFQHPQVSVVPANYNANQINDEPQYELLI